MLRANVVPVDPVRIRFPAVSLTLSVHVTLRVVFRIQIVSRLVIYFTESNQADEKTHLRLTSHETLYAERCGSAAVRAVPRPP